MNIKVPLGLENFSEIRSNGYYYVDKTDFIRKLLKQQFKVSLVTRPRRFGKTLAMSMLEEFFDVSKDSRKNFEGLRISEQRALCEEWQNQWPVIFFSFKDIEGLNFSEAYHILKNKIAELYIKHEYLEKSSKVSEADRQWFRKIKMAAADKADIKGSFSILMRMMKVHYGKTVILLLDEYDVPLAKANEAGYYEEMLDMLRGIFSQSIKSNEFLKFAVITGCLRISRESIFTGINNVVPDTIIGERFDEYFGFTQEDVSTLLADTGLLEHTQEIREWYNGYRFGNIGVYCPWDVLNHVGKLQENPNAEPEAYWANTSGNSILRSFLRRAKRSTKSEIETLIEGKSIFKKISEQLTYNNLEQSGEHLWSVLYATGYLTQRGKNERGETELVIPNREIHEIFENQILEWTKEDLPVQQSKAFHELCHAFQTGDAEKVQKYFNFFLNKSISLRDTFVRKAQKENFYHGMLLGILTSQEEWDVHSNSEAGEGYSDIRVEMEDESIAFIVEMKYAEKEKLEESCREAIRQSENLNYTAELKEAGYTTIYSYGIACFKKQCRVVCEQMR